MGKELRLPSKVGQPWQKNLSMSEKSLFLLCRIPKYKEIYRHQTKNLLIIVDKAHDIKNIDKYALHTRI